jgi:ATP-binding protein involved in chromosome partitioning
MLNEPAVYEALRQVQEPELGRDIVTLNMVKDVVISPDNDVSLKIELTTPACPLKDEIERNVDVALKAIGAGRSR